MQNIAKVGKGYVLFVSRLVQQFTLQIATGDFQYRQFYLLSVGSNKRYSLVALHSFSFLTHLNYPTT
jgi:hypothetical protein